MSDGGYVEKHIPNEGEKTFCEAKQAKSANLPECTVSGGLWEEWKVERPSRSIRCQPCLSAA
jgi:hypothetical protein